jgi:hypothetical protein
MNANGGTYQRSGGRELAWWNSADALTFFTIGVRLLAQILERLFRSSSEFHGPETASGWLAHLNGTPTTTPPLGSFLRRMATVK